MDLLDYFHKILTAHAMSYDAKMQAILDAAPHEEVERIRKKCDPTISDLLEDFKSRIARDELPGEG